MLQGMGLKLEMPKVGCCGQAGSYGYEPHHYDVSMTIGEHVLLPAVRKAQPDNLVIADGFSCRDQIRHGTGRWAMHPAEVLALASESTGSLPQEIPEQQVPGTARQSRCAAGRYCRRCSRNCRPAAMGGPSLASVTIKHGILYSRSM